MFCGKAENRAQVVIPPDKCENKVWLNVEGVEKRFKNEF